MSETIEQTQVDVLRRYPRAVAHMQSQIVARRFGLVLGAGLSTSLGVPQWASLIRNIANDSKISCGPMVARLLKKNESS